MSLISFLLDRPVEDIFRVRVVSALVSFISYYILREEQLDTKTSGYHDDESEEHFQQRINDAVEEIKCWDWRDGYLDIAISVLRDCRSAYQLSNSQ